MEILQLLLIVPFGYHPICKISRTKFFPTLIPIYPTLFAPFKIPIKNSPVSLPSDSNQIISVPLRGKI